MLYLGIDKYIINSVIGIKSVIVMYKDGSYCKLDYYLCCCTHKMNKKILEAMWTSITQQQIEYRVSIFTCSKCDETKILKMYYKKISFDDIAYSFIFERGKLPNKIEENAVGINIICDNKFNDAWKKYHHDNAIYEVLCDKCKQ